MPKTIEFNFTERVPYTIEPLDKKVDWLQARCRLVTLSIYDEHLEDWEASH